MIRFEKIPFNFICDNLTDYQKKAIEIRFEVMNEVDKRNKMQKKDVYISLSSKMNLSAARIEKIDKTTKR